jgi:hypothetical protein
MAKLKETEDAGRERAQSIIVGTLGVLRCISHGLRADPPVDRKQVKAALWYAYYPDFEDVNNGSMYRIKRSTMAHTKAPRLFRLALSDESLACHPSELAGVKDLGPGNRRYAIRNIQAAAEPEVGLYFDEIPIAELTICAGR